MKTEVEKLTNDTFYKILECCLHKNPASRPDITKHTNLSEYSIYIGQLEDSGLIKNWADTKDYFQLTSSGMAIFLNLHSQKQSAKQARRATYFAVLSIVIAAAALLINILK
jgi:predicted transcriptional regulator